MVKSVNVKDVDMDIKFVNEKDILALTLTSIRV